tara:strand:+ start:338 stop:1015 length:678 start_codon:yes stop_codon:yes gene_type:complete
MLDVDFVQRVKVTGLFFLQFYKIVTGTMLTLFIPQNCDGQICSITQNIDNENRYHRMVLSWNSMTMMSFFIMYIFELKRENWSIRYLDIDNDKPDNALKEVIVKEKVLDKRMDLLNLYYYRIVNFTIFMNMVNIGLVVKILYNDYHSQSTISCFVSFSLLILMKLYNSFSVAYQSVKNDKMMSAYMSEFVSYNVLDSDYIEKKLVNKPTLKKIDEYDDIIPTKKP